MQKKLFDFEINLKTPLAYFVRVVDAHISNEILTDINIAQDVLHGIPSILAGEDHSDAECDVKLWTSKRSLLKQILDESSSKCLEDDEKTRFPRAMSNANLG